MLSIDLRSDIVGMDGDYIQSCICFVSSVTAAEKEECRDLREEEKKRRRRERAEDVSEREGSEQGCMTRLPVREPCVQMRQARARMRCNKSTNKPIKELNIGCIWK